jgi:hypothetical protein
MTVDFTLDWLRRIQGVIPPFCVELVLKDGSHYFLHSVSIEDAETETMVLRIWDLRAFGPVEIDTLKARLNDVRDRDSLGSEHEIDPRLDWANLRLHFADVAYCIEWHDRLWPEEARPKVGFRRDGA